MIGLPGILLQALLGVASGLFALGTAAQLRRTPGIKNLVLVLIFVPIFALICWKEVVHALYIRSLRNLECGAVSEVTFNGTALRNVEQDCEIVNAVHQSQWFEPKHGGWRKPAILSIRLQSGETLNLSVGLYRSGAVIIGESEAYSADLPAVLSRLGYSLSSEINR